MSKLTNQEPERGEEKTLVLDIRFSRGVVWALIGLVIIAGVLGYFALEQQQVLASNPQAETATSSQPLFYLTTVTKNGSEADGNDNNGGGVCAEGYHFASMWEIVDPSNLEYNSTSGLVNPDNGSGPPSGAVGWVRTGYISASDTAGKANCTVWNSDSDQVQGTVAGLSTTWESAKDLLVWDVSTSACNTSTYVWCVED